MLLNECGVQLPAVEHRCIPKTKVGGEGRRSLLKCCTIWGDRLPNSRHPSFAKHKEKICSPKYWNPKPCPEIPFHPYLSFRHKAARRTALQLQVPWSLQAGPAPPLPHSGYFLCRGLGAAGHVGALSVVDPRGTEGVSLCPPSFKSLLPLQASMHSGRVQLPSQPCPFPRLDWQVSTSPCCHVPEGSRRASPSVSHPR